MSTDAASVDAYNLYAEEYAKHLRNPQNSIYHSLYEKPAMYKLLPELSGKAVLSIGCGSGEDCDTLRRHGAAEVTGVDISDKLIAIAKHSYPHCSFDVMDMEHLSFPDDSFDFIFSSLTLHYVEDWSLVLHEAFRVLKPQSYFLFSSFHPFRHGIEYQNLHGDYLHRQAMWRMIMPGQGKLQVKVWHKPLGDMTAQISGAGFQIRDIVEPQPMPAMKTASPKDYEELSKAPNFIIFKLFKPVVAKGSNATPAP